MAQSIFPFDLSVSPQHVCIHSSPPTNCSFTFQSFSYWWSTKVLGTFLSLRYNTWHPNLQEQRFILAHGFLRTLCMNQLAARWEGQGKRIYHRGKVQSCHSGQEAEREDLGRGTSPSRSHPSDPPTMAHLPQYTHLLNTSVDKSHCNPMNTVWPNYLPKAPLRRVLGDILDVTHNNHSLKVLSGKFQK